MHLVSTQLFTLIYDEYNVIYTHSIVYKSFDEKSENLLSEENLRF